MNRNYEIKVGAFGRAMVTRFEANQDRGGWRTRNTQEILEYVDEAEKRLKELRERVAEGKHPTGETAQAQQDAILTDCADVANLALIVAENCNAIVYTPKEMGDLGK